MTDKKRQIFAKGVSCHDTVILLDDSVSEAKTLDFLDMSYDLIDAGK